MSTSKPTIKMLSASLCLLSAAIANANTQHHSTAPAKELETVVVHATKLDKTSDRLTQAVSLVGEQEIAEKAHTDLTEVLRGLPGIQFKQAGGPGQFSYPKMRGFGAAHMLLVIDGVKINQASSGDVGNLIGQIDPNTIEKIEVLRGPQAALYGSNATAGVISITTKTGNQKAATVAAETGSLGWNKYSASLRNSHHVADGVLAYSFNTSKTDSDGVIDDEYFNDQTDQLKVSFTNEKFEVGGSYYGTNNRFNYAELKEASAVTDKNKYYYFLLPDPDSYRAAQQTAKSIWLTHFINSQWRHTLRASQMDENDQSLDVDNGLLGYVPAPYDNFTANWMDYYNQGQIVPIYDSGSTQSADNRNRNRQYEYILNYDGEDTRAVFGYERLEQRFRSWGRWGNAPAVEDTLDSYYVNADRDLLDGKVVLSAGVRHDKYESWGNETNGNLGIAVNVTPQSTVFANVGTSFKAPTMSQLFNLTYGVDDLKPESGKTTELGFRQKLFDDKLNWSVTAWRSVIDDLIFYDSSAPNPRASWGFGQYANGDRARTRGAELELTYQFNDNWAFIGNYTYTDAHLLRQNADDYERSVQIARDNANLGLRYEIDKLTVNANLMYTGPRLRWAADLETDSYWRTDLSARYQVTDAVAVYGRIENLFDENIVEEIGYDQPGRYSVVGVEYRFF